MIIAMKGVVNFINTFFMGAGTSKRIWTTSYDKRWSCDQSDLNLITAGSCKKVVQATPIVLNCYLNNKGESVWRKSVCNRAQNICNLCNVIYLTNAFYRSIFKGGIILGRQHGRRTKWGIICHIFVKNWRI